MNDPGVPSESRFDQTIAEGLGETAVLVVGFGFLRGVVTGPRFQQPGENLSNRQTAEGMGLENVFQPFVDLWKRDCDRNLATVRMVVAVVVPEGSSATVRVRRAVPAVFNQPMQRRVDPDKTRHRDAQSQQRRGDLMSESIGHRRRKAFTGRICLQVPCRKRFLVDGSLALPFHNVVRILSDAASPLKRDQAGTMQSKVGRASSLPRADEGGRHIRRPDMPALFDSKAGAFWAGKMHCPTLLRPLRAHSRLHRSGYAAEKTRTSAGRTWTSMRSPGRRTSTGFCSKAFTVSPPASLRRYCSISPR